MIKKLTKRKNSLTLEIDKTITDALGIDQKTNIEMIVMDDMLIIKSKNKQLHTTKNKQAKDITDSLMDKYEPILKKLAKT